MRRLFDGAADQKSASSSAAASSAAVFSPGAFVATLGERGALRAVHVRQQSEVTADPAAKRALELRAFDRQAKLAFLECALARRFDWLQTAHGPPAAAGAPAMPILDYTGFVECLLLCSQLRYEALGPKFERSARASAFLAALFGKADVEAQVRDATKLMAPPRFDAGRDGAALPGEHAAARDVWVACWKRVAVSDIPGWPLWEKAVHDALHPAFATLQAIFVHYAKQGAGFDILAGARTLEAGEYAQLLSECSITGLDGPASLIFATSAADGERDLVTPTSKPESITLPQYIGAVLRLAYAHAVIEYKAKSAGSDHDAAVHALQLLPKGLAAFLKLLCGRARKDGSLAFRQGVLLSQPVQAVVDGRAAQIDAFHLFLGRRGRRDLGPA